MVNLNKSLFLNKKKGGNFGFAIMHTSFRLVQFAIVVAATHGAVNHSHFLPEKAHNFMDRKHLSDHVSLILCHLNVKSIYVYFENVLKSAIVENLLRDTNFCDPPIVTLIKLVENCF